MIQTLYKLRDYKETFVFEKEHPKELRWDDKYKLFMFNTKGERCQGIWFRDKTKDILIAEAILTWQSSNVVHIDGFTVLPSHRGQGLGYQLIDAVIEWAVNSDYSILTGEAREGASWHMFQSVGADEMLKYNNWGGTNETYTSFKLQL
jgi:GNAT superfamily N-acetyltransferase